MQRDDYRLLRSHQGLRDAMQSALSKEPPTRTALADALEAAGLPSSMVDEHVDKLAKLAKQHKLGAKRWHLLQEADELAVSAVKRAAAEDSLLGDLHDLADDDDHDGEQDVRTALARQRDGIVQRGKPIEDGAREAPPVPWRQQR